MRAVLTTFITLAAAAACTTTSMTAPPGTGPYATGTGTSGGNVAADAGAGTAPSFSLDPFYDPLLPYGDWWWSDHWGWVWSPAVSAGWRPYVEGHWLLTDDGWLWDSDEPFGWATYHYGRWTWIDDAGWVWIPGRVYAPAWVVWRSAPGYLGWAPLGPTGAAATGPFAYVFVRRSSFLAPHIARVVEPARRNPAVLPSTRVLHRPEQRDVERATGRRITVQRANEVPVHRVPRRALGTAPLRPRDNDLPGPRGALSPADRRGVIVRPLPARDGDDDGVLERRFADEKRDARDDDEVRQVDRDRVREMRAAHGRRSVPRRQPVATPKGR